MARGDTGRRIDQIDVHVCKLPGTKCAMTIVEAYGAGACGVGYTYEPLAAPFVRNCLDDCVRGTDAYAVTAAHQRMLYAIRRADDLDVAAAAVSAVDIAIWDLKSRLLGIPLAVLLGAVRDEVMVCACAGYVSPRTDSLAREVADYAVRGHRRISISIDVGVAHERVRIARDAAGPSVELVLDGHGAFTAANALALADHVARRGVTFFVDPVDPADLTSMRFMRERSPTAIMGGRDRYDAISLARLLHHPRCVDVLQVDATRCLGITGFLQADAMCAVYGIPLASYGAPAVHVHAGAAAPRLIHIAAPPNHSRIEMLLFDRPVRWRGGNAAYDPTRPGLGIDLIHAEADCMAA